MRVRVSQAPAQPGIGCDLGIGTADSTPIAVSATSCQGKQISGQNGYAITFAKKQVSPVEGVGLFAYYNDLPLFNPNPLKRHSLGAKNLASLCAVTAMGAVYKIGEYPPKAKAKRRAL